MVSDDYIGGFFLFATSHLYNLGRVVNVETEV